MQDKKKLGRRFDHEFKQNAIALVQSGRSIKEVALDLGVSDRSLDQRIAMPAEPGVRFREKT